MSYGREILSAAKDGSEAVQAAWAQPGRGSEILSAAKDDRMELRMTGCRLPGGDVLDRVWRDDRVELRMTGCRGGTRSFAALRMTGWSLLRGVGSIGSHVWPREG